MRYGRRRFIGQVAGIGAGLGLLGCDGPEPEIDGGPRPNPRDAGFDSGIDAPPPPGLSKPPYSQLLSPGSARLRFETRIDHTVPVRIDFGDGMQTLEPTRDARLLEYARPAIIDEVIPDQAGTHVLHELVLEDLPPGVEVEWRVEPPDAEPLEGHFRTAVATGEPFRLGWIADTSHPVVPRTASLLASHAPDVVIHGGDITYQPNPLDTWNGYKTSISPLTSIASMHMVVGNHEFEDQDEITVQYERLYAGQGDAGSTARYFAFTYGHIRFIQIDTESGGLRDMDAPQLTWLDEELTRVDDDPDLAFAVVSFHRPTYSLSRHAPRSTEVRDLLHARFVAHRVPLVIAGHVHAYERFEVDGITYWIDGGGGALLYDTEQREDDVQMWRPGEGELRQAANRSHGVSVLDVEPDGLRLRRIGLEDEGVQDQIEIET